MLTQKETASLERQLQKRDAATIENCAKVAEAHKSCGCSCSQRIPKVIAADIRKLK